MTEFNDDSNKQWMMNFRNYSKEGLNGLGWEAFMEDMIKEDKQEMIITLTPPKNFLKSHGYKEDANVKVQYPVSIGKYSFNKLSTATLHKISYLFYNIRTT